MGAVIQLNPAIQEKVRLAKSITIPQSFGVLLDGFKRFEQRRYPSTLAGVSLARIAGQAMSMTDNGSRAETRRILKQIKTGGAFLILGHGSLSPCGAVKAKQDDILLKGQGKRIDEPASIIQLVDEIPDSVSGLVSPAAEMTNAIYQAKKLLNDPEFKEIIEIENITVVAGVFNGETTDYLAINKRDLIDERKLFKRHPKLLALREQLKSGVAVVRKEGIELGTQYAQVIFVSDPIQIRKTLDPFEEFLDVGGYCCIDSRLQANTPDNPKFPLRILPNRAAGVTVQYNGGVTFSYDDEASIIYLLRHVAGVNSLNLDGEKGNGHIGLFDTDLNFSHAHAIRVALMANPVIRRATNDGETISYIGFDGKELRMINTAYEIDHHQVYRPEVNILNTHR